MSKPFDHMPTTQKATERCEKCGLPRASSSACQGCFTLASLRLTELHQPDSQDIALAQRVLSFLATGQRAHYAATRLFRAYLVNKKQQASQGETELIDEILSQFETLFGKPKKKKS